MLLPTELQRNDMIFFKTARQRPTLTGGNPQLPSALKSLTSVFGMGTGMTSLLSPPDYFLKISLKDKNYYISLTSECQSFF